MPHHHIAMSDVVRRQALWWFRATSGARTRTPVPSNPPTGASVSDTADPEVTARDLSPAFNAVEQVCDLILQLEADLKAIPSGRRMVERARKAREALLPE